MEPTSRSANGFCQGDRGAVRHFLHSHISGHGDEASSVNWHPGSTRDKEYARIARQLRYLVGVTIAAVILLGGLTHSFTRWGSLSAHHAMPSIRNRKFQESGQRSEKEFVALLAIC